MSNNLLKKFKTDTSARIGHPSNVPSNWQVLRLKDIKSNISNAFVDGPFGSNLKTEHFIENGDVYVIDSGYITSGQFNKHRDFKTISIDHFQTVKRSECCFNDIIISKIGANFGMSGILPKLDRPSLVSGNTLKLTINRKKFNLKYIHYQLLNLKANFVFDVLVKGSAQPALSMGLLNPLIFVIPISIPEQTAIANYLDRKTALIDRKIELLRQKAAKYTELKQALINETVTRGLDKTAPLKDSGVAWIGKVPAHWEVCRIADIGTKNQNKNHGLIEANLLSLSYGKIIRKNLDTSFGLLPESFETYQILKSGTIVLRLTDLQNDQKSLRVGLAREKGIITSAYLGLSLRKNINPIFSYYLLHSYDLCKVFYWFGGGLRSTMKFDDVKVIPFILPPINEQNEIANYLDEKTTKIDTIINTINTQITTLQELRKTLINDVVTGQIKVVEDAP